MKRLIACTDGTWDKPGDELNGKSLDSNVCLLYNAILDITIDDIPQLKVYDTGVGTGYTIEDKVAGGITGEGLDKKIKDVYTFLMLNYEPGDHIYLFGFSRGAYTARSLAGFIRNCGILKPENLHLLEKAYELYRDRNDYTTPESDMMVSFRKNYCFENITRIKFIGVWDTVGSLGIPFPWFNSFNQERYKFHDVTLSSTIDYAYHALAVDEHRKLFEPSIWQLSNNTLHGTTTELEQRWFAGVHCNVGGGYADMGLSNDTLEWIVKKANAAGLKFDEVKLSSYKGNIMGKPGNSYTLMYHLWPKVLRSINQLTNSAQVIDESVYQRMAKDPNYRPKNIMPENVINT
jgi:uncharacterized protein (DUF2235 family)